MTVNHILSIPTSSAEQGALAPRCLPLPALCDAYTSVIFLLQKYEWSSSAIAGSVLTMLREQIDGLANEYGAYIEGGCFGYPIIISSKVF